MLMLSRKVGERIRMADNIEVVVTAIQGDRIKFGIEAPKTIQVLRGELQLCASLNLAAVHRARAYGQ